MDDAVIVYMPFNHDVLSSSIVVSQSQDDISNSTTLLTSNVRLDYMSDLFYCLSKKRKHKVSIISIL